MCYLGRHKSRQCLYRCEETLLVVCISAKTAIHMISDLVGLHMN